MKQLAEGDRIVVKFNGESVMGYFMNYYNGDYAVCSDDADGDHQFLAHRRRLFKAPAEPANVQIFEAAE